MLRLVGMVADINARKAAEERLQESEKLSRQIVLGSPVAMVVTRGPEHKGELVNDKFTALFGYTIEDMPDEAAWWPLAYPDEAYREAIKSEWRTRVEAAILTAATSYPWRPRSGAQTVRRRKSSFTFPTWATPAW